MEIESKLTCHICKKSFGRVSTKNQHLKRIHKEILEPSKSIHIKCPLCPDENRQPLVNHDNLLHHLTAVHSVSIKQTNLTFRNMEELDVWRAQENREVDYVLERTVKRENVEENRYYSCNRSNTTGSKSICTKRAMKAGGSIKILGTCPSRICAKILRSGMVTVRFIETHVGHGDELRSKRLLKIERTTIQAHRKAEQMDGLVELVEFGKFEVKSTQGEKMYVVSYNNLCDEDCRNVYCSECKICIHRYICECSEFAVKTALCKHIHAVVLYERRSVSVPGLLGAEQEQEDSLEENLTIQEPTISKTPYSSELSQFLEEKCEGQKEENKSISHERRREILIEDFTNCVKNTKAESLGKLEMLYAAFKRNLDQEDNALCKKRKMDMQTYYPHKK